MYISRHVKNYERNCVANSSVEMLCNFLKVKQKEKNLYLGAPLIINVLASIIRLGKGNSHGHRGFSSDMADHSAIFGFYSVFLLLSLAGPEELELERPQPQHQILKRQAQEGLLFLFQITGSLDYDSIFFFYLRWNWRYNIQHWLHNFS